MPEYSYRDRTRSLTVEPTENILQTKNEKYCQSYLSRRETRGGVSIFDKWSRSYYVLQQKSLFCYKNKQVFETSPTEYKIGNAIVLNYFE